MFLLISALKEFNDSQVSKSKVTTRRIVVKVSHLFNDNQGSKSKVAARWILVKVSHLNNV